MHDARYFHIPCLLTSNTINRTAPISVLQESFESLLVFLNGLTACWRLCGCLCKKLWSVLVVIGASESIKKTRMMSKFAECRVWQKEVSAMDGRRPVIFRDSCDVSRYSDRRNTTSNDVEVSWCASKSCLDLQKIYRLWRCPVMFIIDSGIVSCKFAKSWG